MNKIQNYSISSIKLLRSPEGLWRAGMFGVVFFFVLTGISLTTRLATLGEEADNITHSQNTLGTIDDLFGKLRDIESGERGYLLTHKVEYLDPKKDAEKKIMLYVDELQQSTVHNKKQSKLAEQIKMLTTEKLNEVNRILNVAQEHSFEAGADALKEGKGKSLMDSLRITFRAMQRTEELALRKGVSTFEKTRQGGKIIALVTVIITILLTVLVAYINSLFRTRAAILALETAGRKAAEDALHTSEQRLRSALTHIPLIVYSTDKEGRYTWIHDPEHTLTLTSILGKRDDELYSSGDVKELRQIQREVLSTRKAIRKILKLPYTGELLSYDVIVEPYAPQKNTIVGLTISAFDIQNQILAQEQLKKSAQELRTITNTMPQIVWSTDASGIPDYFNERWYEYTGMSKSDTEEWNRAKYLHPDDVDRVNERWNHSLTTGEPYEIEYRLKGGITGNYRWFIGRALPVFDDAGNILRWFGTSTDVHDQKQSAQEREKLLESERVARDEAERVTRAKDEYIAILSHELRGPLNSILGWTQIMRTKSDDKSITERGIAIIERNARAQSQLVSDLFDMHRINAGKLDIVFEKLHLSDLVEAVVDSLIPAAEEKKIKLIKHIAPNVCDIPGEGGRLTQVITNILNNSLKFTPEGGLVTITLENREGKAIITITDTGVGIEAGSLSTIFDRYNQGTGNESNKHSGLGLGLSIARSFILMHKGTIEAFSEGSGKGTTFRIILPCAHEELSSVSNSLIPPHAILKGSGKLLTGITILFIEDQDDSREAVTRLLREQGAEVIACVSCVEALEKLRTESPHIIVSDISMRGMDGYMFMKIVRESNSTIHSIALTAFAQPEDKKKAIESGFNVHLSKPLDAVKLTQTITTLLSNSKSACNACT